MRKVLSHTFFLALFLFYSSILSATEFEKLGDAIAKALGTTKVFKTSAKLGKETISVFYSKDTKGKADRYAVLQTGIYEPNCTHTWVVGLASNGNVETIRVVEMSCPHAFPTRQASYLDQYRGKGPKDLKTLKNEIHTVAKATGSSQLTTDAVMKSITAVQSLKGKI